ncbi:MAG: acetylornithine/succinylornithine family transaminase [bacterium]|nr:acetylornithine/succinylornithine family transaminase [bacterium]
MDIRSMDAAFVANTYDRYRPVLVSGSGSLVYDEDGKRYIDLGTGIAVNSFGVADPVWAAAVAAQAGKLQHACNKYFTAPQAMLAQKLCERTGMKKVFFGNSGAEANECALKIARKYGGAARPNIITLKNSFHGRTIATLAATGQDAMHRDFGPFPDGFLYAPANDLPAMQALMDGSVAGVLVELVQGEGGVNVLDADYVRGVEALCREHDALFMVDEVQTGNGRTGALYAYQLYGVQPDVVTTAKGLAGGLPIGAALIGARAEHVLLSGDHGSTFGGNPVCAAGAISILDRIDDALLAGVRERSDYIVRTLSAVRGVRSVTGLGLMLGVETEKPAAEVVQGCMERGVLALTAKNKVRLLPALNIPLELLREAMEILKGVIEA